ncbi:hypothetical protein BH11ACT4_BH11ACT4_13900 [soil metagenome]
MRVRWSTAAAFGALCLALSACAPTAGIVPPGPGAAELDAAVTRDVDLRWQSLMLPDSVDRPSVPVVELATTKNWSYLQLSCYQAAGLNARDVSGDFTVDGFPAGDPRAQLPYAASLAIYTCQAQYPMDPRQVGYLTDSQVLYMYDYFRARLAPCLELHGYAVPAPPQRSAYLASVRSGHFWDPYLGADSQPISGSAVEQRRIDLECTPLPDDPYRDYRPFAVAG